MKLFKRHEHRLVLRESYMGIDSLPYVECKERDCHYVAPVAVQRNQGICTPPLSTQPVVSRNIS